MRSRMPPEYQIPDNPDSNKMDAAYLRTCLGIRTIPGEEPPPLPVAVRRAHYDMARSLSLLGAMGPTGMDATQLACVVVMAMRDPDMEMPKKQAEQKAVAPKPPAVATGTDVTVAIDGQDVAAQYLRKGPGGRLALLVDGAERFFRPEDVRFEKRNGEPVNETVEV